MLTNDRMAGKMMLPKIGFAFAAGGVLWKKVIQEMKY